MIHETYSMADRTEYHCRKLAQSSLAGRVKNTHSMRTEFHVVKQWSCGLLKTSRQLFSAAFLSSLQDNSILPRLT